MILFIYDKLSLVYVVSAIFSRHLEYKCEKFSCDNHKKTWIQQAY